MPQIDDRVVAMSFESTKFQSGVSATLSSLDKLNAAIKNIGASGDGFANIEKSANKVNFLGIGTALDKLKSKFGHGIPEADQAFSDVEKGSNKVNFLGIGTAFDKVRGMFGRGVPEAVDAFSGIENASGKVEFRGLSTAIDGITAKFSVMEGAAAVALGNIATKGILAGKNLIKSLTIAPVSGGFKEYETQLNAVQTILANTDGQRISGLKAVNTALSELNHYADKTIYNFTEMAKNIGTFTAAGVDLKTAVGSIKGIANLAAISGSNSQQASTAMYQLSQAISAGRVGLQDWNSVVNAGMGGALFQKALMRTAENMGTVADGAVKIDKATGKATINGETFRNSIMAKPGEESWLSGDVLTNTLKQLSGDMTDAQLKAEGFSDAQIKAIQDQAKMAVNAATQVKTLHGLLDTVKEAVGSGWAQTWQIVFGDFGEAKKLFTGLSNVIGGFVGANSKARNSLLKTWKELGGRTALIDGLKAAFEALKSIIKPISQAFREIFPAKTASDLFFLTTKFRDFMESLKIGPETAENLKRSFKGFFAILDIGKQIVGGIFDVIKTLFSEVGKGAGGFLGFTGSLGDALVALDEWLKKGDRFKRFFEGLGSVLSLPIKLFEHLGDTISGFFSGVGGSGLGDFNKSISTMVDVTKPGVKIITQLASALYTLSGLLWAAISPAVKEVVNVFRDFSHEVGDALSQDNFENVFKIIQTTLIGGIFLAVKKGFTDGLKLDLTGGLSDSIKKPLDTLNSSLKSLQTNIKANSLKQIAIAIALIAASAIALSYVDAEDLTKSMTAIGAGFGELLGALAILSKIGTGGMLVAPVVGAGLILMAAAIDVLVIAVLALAQLDWEKLAKGLTGVGVLLGELAVASGPLAAAGPRLLLAAPGILVLATGLVILSGAMKIFATMNWEEMAKGLVSVAGSLIAIGLASKLMGPSMILIGPGLLMTGAALAIIAGSMKIFGTMDLGTIGKGVLAIAGSLVAIGLAMNLMPLTLPITAAGLMLVGIALTEIAGAIAIIGSMKLVTIVKGLIGLGGALGVLAVGLKFMSSALPGAAALALVGAGLALIVPSLGILGSMKWGTILKSLIALGLALGVIGVAGTLAGPGLVLLGLGVGALGLGVLAVGKGVELLVKAILLLDSQGSKALATFVAAFVAMAAAIPKIILDFIKGLVSIAAEIVKLGPQIIDSMTKITLMLIQVLINAAPKAAEAIGALIMAILKVIGDNAGPIIAGGVKLLMQLLQGIEQNIGKVVGTVGNIIIKFLNALATKMPQIMQAGAKLVVKFLEGIANNIGDILHAGAKAIAKFIEGIGNNLHDIVVEGGKMAGKLIDAVFEGTLELIKEGTRAVRRFMRGLTQAIDDNAEEIGREAGRLTAAIIKGIVKGFVGFVDVLAHELTDPIDKALHGVAESLGIASSFNSDISNNAAAIGKSIIDGMVKGIDNNAHNVFTAGLKAAQAAIDATNKRLGVESPSKVFHEIGRNVMLGLANGITESRNSLTASTSNALKTWLSKETLDALALPEIKEALKNMKIEHPKFFESFGKIIPEYKAAGTFLLNGFLEGITGSPSDISSAISEMENQLRSAVQKLQSKYNTDTEAIATLTAKREDLRNTKEIKALKDKIAVREKADLSVVKQKAELKKLNEEAEKHKGKIDKVTEAIEKHTKSQTHNGYVLAHAENALHKFNGRLSEGRKYLLALSAEVDKLSEDLDKAQAKLDEVTAARDDALTSYQDQYSALPSIDLEAENPLGKYTDALKKSVVDIAVYKKTLDDLLALGLDDTTYKLLLEGGTADQIFANQLLAGGPAAIAALNALDKELDTAAHGLAYTASQKLYQAGVDVANEVVNGITNGIKAKKKKLKDAMEDVANIMIKELRIMLGIKSPSKVFAQLGEYSMKGLAYGINASSKAVAKATESVGDDALSIMKDKMAMVSNALANEIDANPTITPILDLTQVRSDLSTLSNVVPISAEASYGQAMSISSATQASSSETADISEKLAQGLQLVQNNYSPKALSETEIYRQTNNQLSQAKSILGLP